MEVHLSMPDKTLCGRTTLSWVTDNPSDITCLECKKLIESKDFQLALDFDKSKHELK